VSQSVSPQQPLDLEAASSNPPHCKRRSKLPDTAVLSTDPTNNKRSETVTFLVFFFFLFRCCVQRFSFSYYYSINSVRLLTCLLACLLSSCFFLCESREECLAMVRRETGRKEREERRGGRVCCSGRNSNLESIRSGGTPTVTFAFWKIFTYCYGVLLLYPPTLIRLIWTFLKI